MSPGLLAGQILFAAVTAAPGGVVIDEVHAGFGGEQAGLRPGDVLLRWERAANPPVNPASDGGDLRSQFDFVEVGPCGYPNLSSAKGSPRLWYPRFSQ